MCTYIVDDILVEVILAMTKWVVLNRLGVGLILVDLNPGGQ